jgi:hypothetical protein
MMGHASTARDERVHLEALLRSAPTRDERRRGREGSLPLIRTLIRTWSLLQRLDHPQGFTIPELAAEYNVSVHTIRRELLSLRSAGLPVMGRYGAGRKFRWRVVLAAPAIAPNVTANVTHALRVLRELERAGRQGRTLEQLAMTVQLPVHVVRALVHVLEGAGVRLTADTSILPVGRRWRLAEPARRHAA